MPLWTFTAHVSAARQQELLSVTSFLEVVERIRTCVVENFKVEPRRNPPCLGTRAVNELSRAVGAALHAEYELIRQKAERARKLAEQARTRLEEHQEQHGC